MSFLNGKKGKPITVVPAGPEVKQDVDATFTPSHGQFDGMQIPTGLPTHEKAPYSQHDPMFNSQRIHIGLAATVVHIVPNIPRSWVVWVNRGGGAGATIQVIQGDFDVTLIAGDSVTFPGRTNRITLTDAVAEVDVTVIALGDDLLRF